MIEIFEKLGKNAPSEFRRNHEYPSVVECHRTKVGEIESSIKGT